MNRHEARQKALQILFSREFHGENDLQYTEEEILELDGSEGTYCRALVEAAQLHLEDIDGIISTYARGWNLSQMNRTDKNVLRLALCELAYPVEKLDVSIVLNEAILLAKEFGGPASSKFVNGILGAYVRNKA